MVLIQNKSGRPLKLNYIGKEYILPVDEILEIPETSASLYFGYGVENLTTQHIHWCCERLKLTNPELAHMTEEDIWDNIVRKIAFNTEVEPVKQQTKRR